MVDLVLQTQLKGSQNRPISTLGLQSRGIYHLLAKSSDFYRENIFILRGIGHIHSFLIVGELILWCCLKNLRQMEIV